MLIREDKLKTQTGEVFGWVIDGIVSDETCNKIIEHGKPSMKPSTTLDPYIPDYRTSSNTFAYYGNNKAVDEVAHLVCDFIQYPVENFEGMQIVHYNPGEYYKTHHDYFEKNTDHYESEIARGGQRTWTAFLYLNDVSKGGETNFPYVNFTVKPKRGTMILWMNTNQNGEVIDDSLHEALSPKSGEKWGANIWVREKKFR
tara:strand:+ start:185 stop:784 length:600 start_codon:yes stop_codon:yes gene_type:complete